MKLLTCEELKELDDKLREYFSAIFEKKRNDPADARQAVSNLDIDIDAILHAKGWNVTTVLDVISRYPNGTDFVNGILTAENHIDYESYAERCYLNEIENKEKAISQCGEAFLWFETENSFSNEELINALKEISYIKDAALELEQHESEGFDEYRLFLTIENKNIALSYERVDYYSPPESYIEGLVEDDELLDAVRDVLEKVLKFPADRDFTDHDFNLEYDEEVMEKYFEPKDLDTEQKAVGFKLLEEPLERE